MLVILRTLLTAAFLYAIFLTAQETVDDRAGDVTPALRLGLLVILGLGAGAAWAPYFGAKISQPLTGPLLDDRPLGHESIILRWIRFCDSRKLRRLTLALCLLQGVRNPSAPSHFIIGLRNASPGSWLEKTFAREVFRFDNIQNCVAAYRILRSHGITPPVHHNPEVSLLILSLDRTRNPAPSKFQLPAPQPPPAPRRNSRIKLFEHTKTTPPTGPNPPS